MSGVAARPRSPMTDALRTIQAPVRERLDEVSAAMQRIVTSGVPMIEACRAPPSLPVTCMSST